MSSFAPSSSPPSFVVPLDISKTTKIIRTSYPDLPSFSQEAVLLMSKIAADGVKDVIEAAYAQVEPTDEGGLRKITKEAMLRVIQEGEGEKFKHLNVESKVDTGSLQADPIDPFAPASASSLPSSIVPPSLCQSLPLPPSTVDGSDPFVPPLDFQKVTKLIRSSYSDLPSFNKDSVHMIDAMAGERVKEVIEAAYKILDEQGSGGRQITLDSIIKAIKDSGERCEHLAGLGGNMKGGGGSRKKQKVEKAGKTKTPVPPKTSNVTSAPPVKDNFPVDPTNTTQEFEGGLQVDSED
eukprot:CAMPEP_0118661714 /NCGR_PEP_ID=MMETSP0785-20121206/16439_1 /TAXON_ID=91992 /ORGANISM="Bolidomonas pacifica, Strain CCMP 1866" /LENGTH=293 /DNA_ID=CAMNT_0006555197 /DNA_START=203 /DNA_END=1081 /DNA_ORIENTATION=+